mmetsp:Transcript_54039/g.156980  ORF Transcript_54039/g.156980 Transcript_54039/m.156980 type:complete len:108 (+) Transcript_54039:219-542(+)
MALHLELAQLFRGAIARHETMNKNSAALVPILWTMALQLQADGFHGEEQLTSSTPHKPRFGTASAEHGRGQINIAKHSLAYKNSLRFGDATFDFSSEKMCGIFVPDV